MKKMTVMLALLCVLALSFSAMAEAATAVTWDDVSPVIEASGLEGGFYALEELGLAMWLPDGIYSVEVSEEDAAAGRLYLMMSEDQSCAITVDAIHVDGMTLDSAYQNAVANGMTEPEYINVNGLSAISYKNDAINGACVVLVDTNSNAIIFTFTPMDTDEAALAFTVITASIMPLQ